MTFYRQREAKNRMRKETGSEVLSEHAANTLIEIASRTFGDLICRFEGRQAFISAGANDRGLRVRAGGFPLAFSFNNLC